VSVAQKIAGCVLHLIAKVTRISYAKFYCNRLTNVQDIQNYASLVVGTCSIVVVQTALVCNKHDTVLKSIQ